MSKDDFEIDYNRVLACLEQTDEIVDFKTELQFEELIEKEEERRRNQSFLSKLGGTFQGLSYIVWMNLYNRWFNYAEYELYKQSCDTLQRVKEDRYKYSRINNFLKQYNINEPTTEIS